MFIIILIDFVFRRSKNRYAQVLLEECKYGVKEKKIRKYSIDDIEICFNSDREFFDEKNSDEENYFDEENFDQ